MSDYLLADDLSGALEAGAAFRRQGQRVKLAWDGVPKSSEAAGTLRVVSTETRNLAPAEAAAAVRQVLSVRQASGDQLVFKKVDSTLRGPVGAELHALIEVLSPPLVILCPANPGAGRTMTEGLLKVNGVPLGETDFRDDPIWLMQTGDVAELLRGQGAQVSPCRLSLEALRNGGPSAGAMIMEALNIPAGILLADATTQTDIELLVRVARRHAPNAILAGTGAMAVALAAETVLFTPDLHYSRPQLQPMLLLCGSRHPASRRQLEHLTLRTGGEVITVNVDGFDESALVTEAIQTQSKHGSAAVRFTLVGDTTFKSANRIQSAIAKVAPELVTQCGPAVLFLTGGETAWTVCQALRAIALEVLEELTPGVVLSRMLTQSGAGLLIVTKPGGFGPDAMLTNLLARK